MTLMAVIDENKQKIVRLERWGRWVCYPRSHRLKQVSIWKMSDTHLFICYLRWSAGGWWRLLIFIRSNTGDASVGKTRVIFQKFNSEQEAKNFCRTYTTLGKT